MVDSGTRLFSVLFLLVFTQVALASSFSLGSAHRTRMDDKYLYSMPITVIIDGYSTFRAVLTSEDTDFIDQTTSEIVKTKTGGVLRIFTPRHLDDVVLGVRIDYQGRSISKTYRLKADKAGVDVPTNGTKSIAYGCERQWILRGTLVGNIKRILKACGYELGKWPMKDATNYVDFVISQPSSLAASGGLAELLDYVEKQFGFSALMPLKNKKHIGFIDLTTKF